MGKHIFLATVLLVLLAGCRSEGTDQTTSTPEGYVIALEAYEQIRPAMLAWHEDAIVIGISSLGGTPPPEWRPDSTGKAPSWGFDVCSPSARKRTSIDWTRGKITVGIDGEPGYEVSAPAVVEGLPLDTMIDSNEAVEIAMGSGTNPDWTLLNIRIDRFDNVSEEYLPPSWGLTYVNPENASQQRRIIIDVVTGEVIRNDFAK